MRRSKVSVAVAVFVSLVLAGSVMAGSIQDSRLLPTDKVMVYDGGKKVAEYTREMPVPQGLALSCIGKCAVRLADISLVAEDNSTFSIDSRSRATHLGVNSGVVYFRISAMSGPLTFMTPKGAVSVNQLFFNAASNTKMLEGYLKVTENSSEVGVIDGGNLQLLTKDGPELIKPGQRFILAVADLDLAQTDSEEEGEVAAESEGLENSGNAANSAGPGGGLSQTVIDGVVMGGAILTQGTFSVISRADDDREASPFQ